METATIKKKIEALAAEASPNSVTPPMVANIMSDLTDMLGATRSVQDVNVLRRSGEITLEFVVVNNETGAQEVVNVILPSADPARAGLMSASDSTAVRTLKTWFDAVSDNTVVANLVYDEAASETDSVCLKVLSFNHLGARKTYSVKIPEASATKAGVMSSDDKKKLDELEGGASPMVAARLRLGVNKTGQHFRIHGKGLLPTDEVRLYRNVHSISHWDDSPDGTSKSAIKRKGWREVKYLGQGGNYIAFPYLELATDVMENSPLANEVNVLVRVKQNGQDVYTGELIDFFVDYYLYLGTGNNHDIKDALYIRNGRKTKKVEVDSTGEYFSTARTVDWAVLVLRDGKPITDFMPFKWLVETAREISAPMDIQACIDDTLKVSAVPYNHYAGNGASETVKPMELPNVDVVTKLTRYSNSSSEAFDITASNVNLKTGAVNTISAFSIPSATFDTMGLITSGMVQRIELLYADYIQRKYSGQNVVVLEYDPSRYKGSTAHFNGKEYALNGSLCVFDLGDKKVINNTTDDEQTFVSAITNVLFLPEGITNYDYAFHPLNSNNYSFRVSAKIDMSQCKSARGMFATQAGFRHIDTSDWDMRNVENLYHAFYGAHLYELDASRWNTEKCTSFNGTFVGAFGLGAKIDLSGVSLQSATDVNAMFFGTYSSCYITLGENFFNAPNINAFQLKYVPLSAELKQSLINCFDRKAAGQQTLTLSLPTKMLPGVTALTEEEKAAIKAKGYELA